MKTVNCVHFNAKGRCECKLLKRWYGKPVCIQLVDWNESCKHKVLATKPEKSF
jgi:hypothetical protein